MGHVSLTTSVSEGLEGLAIVLDYVDFVHGFLRRPRFG